MIYASSIDLKRLAGLRANRLEINRLFMRGAEVTPMRITTRVGAFENPTITVPSVRMVQGRPICITINGEQGASDMFTYRMDFKVNAVTVNSEYFLPNRNHQSFAIFASELGYTNTFGFLPPLYFQIEDAAQIYNYEIDTRGLQQTITATGGQTFDMRFSIKGKAVSRNNNITVFNPANGVRRTYSLTRDLAGLNAPICLKCVHVPAASGVFDVAVAVTLINGNGAAGDITNPSVTVRQ